MKSILPLLVVATLPFCSALADAPPSKNAKVTPVYQHELPNVPGKSIKGVLRVNSVHPGPIDTDMIAWLRDRASFFTLSKRKAGGIPPRAIIQAVAVRDADHLGNDPTLLADQVGSHGLHDRSSRPAASCLIASTMRRPGRSPHEPDISF